MPKKANTNIFDLKIKDKSLLKNIVGIVFFFSVADLILYNTAYEKFEFWLYSVLFRIIVFIAFMLYIKTAYQYFKYVKFFLLFTVLPTILLSSYAYINTFDIIGVLIIMSIYIIFFSYIYIKIKNIPIDYPKTAKKLIEVSNEPLDLIGNKFYVSKLKEDKKVSKVENIITSIPLWAIYAFPVILANSTLAYFSESGFMVLMTSIALIFCLGFISIGLVSYQNIYIFHEAQKILDERKKKKKGKK